MIHDKTEYKDGKSPKSRNATLCAAAALAVTVLTYGANNAVRYIEKTEGAKATSFEEATQPFALGSRYDCTISKPTANRPKAPLSLSVSYRLDDLGQLSTAYDNRLAGKFDYSDRNVSPSMGHPHELNFADKQGAHTIELDESNLGTAKFNQAADGTITQQFWLKTPEVAQADVQNVTVKLDEAIVNNNGIPQTVTPISQCTVAGQ